MDVSKYPEFCSNLMGIFTFTFIAKYFRRRGQGSFVPELDLAEVSDLLPHPFIK